MDLAYFPMDVQSCELRIASWGYTSDDITYKWKLDPDDFPIVLAQDITLSNFRVINFTCRSWDRSLSTGMYNWWHVSQHKYISATNHFKKLSNSKIVLPTTLVEWKGTDLWHRGKFFIADFDSSKKISKGKHLVVIFVSININSAIYPPPPPPSPPTS